MSNSILYYPTIEFQPEDYQWLWNAALFADKIYRIVPPGYELHEPRNIRELCATEEIGIPISPVPYAAEASREFSDFMHEHKRKAAALALIDREETEYIRMHTSKMDVRLLKEIFHKPKRISEDENWLYAKPNTANFYMTYLANLIAQRNGLSLWTRNQELWTTSTYFLHGGNLQDDYRPSKKDYDPSTQALISIMIPDLFPQNLLDITPKEILSFREKRKDERTQFISAIEDLRGKLAQADAPEVIGAILNDEKKRIDLATQEYKKSMDLLKAARFGGVLTTAVTVAADAMGYMNCIPDLYKGLLGSAGLWAGVLTGLVEQKVTDTQNNPYTYLAYIKSGFSFHPGAAHIAGSKSSISRYNYTLYRGFEEFIND